MRMKRKGLEYGEQIGVREREREREKGVNVCLAISCNGGTVAVDSVYCLSAVGRLQLPLLTLLQCQLWHREGSNAELCCANTYLMNDTWLHLPHLLITHRRFGCC